MSFPQHCSSHNCNQIRKGISSVLSHISRYLHPKHDKISLLPLLLAGAMAPSNLTVNILTTSTHPEMSSWLLCEVSGFFPENIHLMWLSVHSKMKSTNFVTANPTPQPGGTFQTWSVLRLPVALSSSLDTYTCVVEHEASKTKLNASKSLAISGIVNTIQHSCIMDEQSDSYMDLEEENGLWPTMCTFVALFLLTLLYSGFVTFIKVK